MGKVLIIDDEKQILSLLSRIIGLEGYEVFQATNCKVGIKQLEQNDPEVVLCDVCLPDGSGVELVSELKRLRPLSEVILLTAHGNIPDGVQAIKNGAFDYITKGDDNNKILPLIAKAMEKATVAYSQQKAVGKQYSFATVIGRSPAIEEAVSLARIFAPDDARPQHAPDARDQRYRAPPCKGLVESTRPYPAPLRHGTASDRRSAILPPARPARHGRHTAGKAGSRRIRNGCPAQKIRPRRHLLRYRRRHHQRRKNRTGLNAPQAFAPAGAK